MKFTVNSSLVPRPSQRVLQHNDHDQGGKFSGRGPIGGLCGGGRTECLGTRLSEQ